MSDYNWAPYDPATSCVKMPFGMTNLMAYLLKRFDWSRSMGICNCRLVNGGDTRSHHSECRAGDWGIDTNPDGSYIPELGDPLIELLGPHGKKLGLDHIILNRVIYSATSPDGRPYTGRHPHFDHAHMGIVQLAAHKLNMTTIIAVLGLPEGDDMAILSPEAQQFWEDNYQKALTVLGEDDMTNEDYLHTSVNHIRDHPDAGTPGPHTHTYQGETSE